MKSSLYSAAVVAVALGAATPAQAQSFNLFSNSNLTKVVSGIVSGPIHIPVTVQHPTWRCEHYNHAVCASGDLTNKNLKQVLILSAGFQTSESATFWSAFEQMIDEVSGSAAGSVWTVQKKNNIIYIGYFTGGDELGTAGAFAGAEVLMHPIRPGYGLTLTQDAVYDKINQIASSEIGGLSPFSAGAIFNTHASPVTANAAPPSLVRQPFGVSKFTLDDVTTPYVPSHELAHAGLNYLDEYTESGLQNLNPKSLDVITPLFQLDGTWPGFVAAISNLFGVYSVKFSEILVNNGSENMTTSQWPSTVGTNGYTPDEYLYQGGMFFGQGTWHEKGANLMNSNTQVDGPDDGFAYAHSPAQQRSIDIAFGDYSKTRPNDRLVNAGPEDGWPLVFGSDTHIMMQDADKHHHFQATKSYNVQVGWYERDWSVCWAWIVPYPCYQDNWKVAQTSVAPTARSINLKMTFAWTLITTVQDILADIGYCEINTEDGQKFNLCENSLSSVTDAFLPTTTFDLPYQDADVPATQWMTTYYWRFATDNGYWNSGWTAWSSFFRSL